MLYYSLYVENYDITNGSKKMSREGKIHLVESYSGPKSCYKNITNEAKYSALKEAAQNLHTGKNRLNEAQTINKVKKILTESKLDEVTQNNILKGLQEVGANVDEVELWQFPVSRVNTPDEPNLNGRVYNRQLWENVINKQRDVWQYGTGLANHPDDDEDGDFMKQSILWLDGFIGDDGIVYGIGTFIGEGGILARQIISLGGRVGFSTSGYGDFLKDKITVDPDGYEIDRFADLVLNPSQGVYGDYRDTMKKQVTGETTAVVDNGTLQDSVQRTDDKKSLTESVVTEKTSLNESVTDETLTLSEELVLNHYSDAIKAISKESNKLWESKIEKLENLTKRIKKESLSKSSKVKLNEQITNVIDSIMKDARNVIQEGYDARKICEDLGISNISKLMNIKERLEDFASLEDCLNSANKEAKKYKELYEAKANYALTEAENSFETEEKLESLKRDNASLKKTLTDSNNKNKDLKSRLSEAEDTIESLNEHIDDLKEALEGSKVRLNKFKESSKNLNTEVTTLKESLLKTESKLKSTSSLKEGFSKHKDSLIAENVKLVKENNRLKDLLNEAEKTIYVLKQRNLKTRTSLVEKQRSEKKLQNKLNISEENLLQASRRNKVLLNKTRDLTNINENLNSELSETKETLSEARKTAALARKTASVTKQVLAEEKAVRSKLEESEAKRVAEAKIQAEKDARDARIAAVREKLHIKENAKKQALKEAEFYDSEEMFKDSDAIDAYLDDLDITDRDQFNDVKTTQELQNRLLFSNELLDDEAEEVRGNTRTPTDLPETLADMFN